MAVSLYDVWLAALVGMGGTLTMDLWAFFLRQSFGINAANYCLVGRWICHMPAGTFAHANISQALKKPRECSVGWLIHYGIGMIYAIALLLLTAGGWLRQPSLVGALCLGLATLVFPLFLMQPAFGLGIASARTPNPWAARIRSLMAHTAFSIGLYLSAVAVNILRDTY